MAIDRLHGPVEPDDSSAWEFLYLTTTGWLSGRPHRIEIWYTELDRRYYLISELRERAHWVQNIEHCSAVSFEVRGGKHAGKARIVHPAEEPDLARRVRAAFDAMYGWSNGLIVEVSPLRNSDARTDQQTYQ